MRNKSRKLIITIAVFALMIFVTFWIWRPSGAEAAWFDDSFAYRNSVPISSHTAAENNVYISTTIDTSTSGQFQADCGDLRFTDYAGNSLNYYIVSGCTTASTVVHVFFDTMPAGAQTLYYYYGNPSAQNGFQPTDFSTQAASYAVGTIGSQEKGGAPVAYWKFDDGTGTNAQDSSPNNNDGTITGATWQTEDQCVSGKCLKFNGTSDFININNSTIFNGTSSTITVSGWVKHIPSNDGIMVAKGGGSSGGWNINTSSDGKVYVAFKNGSGNSVIARNSSSTLNSNQWNFVTVNMTVDTTTLGNNNIQIYVNGSLNQGSLTQTSLPTVSTAKLKIGARGADGSETTFYQGFIDDVKIYNYARTAAQVKSDFASRGSQKGVSAQLSTINSSLSTGLVGYWKMDEATWSGTLAEVVDASGNANHGQAAGATGGKAYSSTGKFGNGGFFDGVDDYVSIPDNSTLKTFSSMTVSTWFKATNWTNQQIIVGKDGNSGWYWQYVSGALNFYVSNTNKGNVGSPSTGAWHHLVATYDGSNIRTFLDGTENTGGTLTGTMPSSTGELLIGSFSSGPLYKHNGSIDETRIYNRALSPREVRDLYNWAPGPVGYWNMDEKTGSTTNDSSGNGNTGTITGALWTNGKYGGGLIYDGTNKYLNIPDPSSGILDPLYAYSISTWVKFTSTTNYGFIVSKSNGGSGGFELFRDTGSGQIRFSSCDGGGVCTGGYFDIQTTAQYNDGNWHHIGATAATNSTAKIYIDGVLVKESSTITQNNINTTDPLTIGSRGNHGSLVRFNGSIDDVKIYNYARTQKQIVEDMSGGAGSGSARNVGTQNPVGYWKFDEGYGTTAFNSGTGGSLNGTITGATWNNNGKFNKALNFDGVGNYIDVGTNSALNFGTNDFTISTWIKTNQTSVGRIITKRTGTGWYSLLINYPTANKVSLESSGTGPTAATSTINDGAWHNIIVTKSGTTATYYIDGKPNGTTVVASDTGNAASFEIGRYSAGGQYFNGLIDEVKIYNYALTQDEVALDYNHGLALALGNTGEASNSATIAYCVPGSSDSCSAPVGEWNFEEGSGSSVQDLSGGGGTGTVTGATYVPGKQGKALNFSGGTDTVTVSNSLSIKSIEFWIYPSTTTQNLIDLRTAATAANISVSSGTISATGFTSPTIYVNGIVSSTLVANTWQYVTITTGTTITANAIQFGRISSTSLTGKLDSIRIFDYTRTAAQVAWDYNQGKPIGHWRFDECQGAVANDSSGNGNNPTISIGGTGTQTAVGTCTSSGAWFNGATGKYNSSLNFDGTDDYASKTSPANLPSGANPFSTSLWIKSTSGTSNLYILKWGTPATKNMNAIIYYGGTNSISHAFYAADLSSGNNTITNGAWNHVLVTWDGTTRRIYINGRETASDAPTSINVTANQTLYFATYAGSSNFFPGQLDDVKIFNYALTATQAKTLYNENFAVRFGL